MAAPRDGRIIPGVILVVLGLALLAAQFVPGIGGEVVVPALGAAFLVLYFYTRTYGFLIPGCILTGLGLGILAETRLAVPGVEPVVLGLGLGFVAIFAIDAAYTRFSNWWPLIPGGILVVVALAPAFPQLAPVIGKLWPLGLVIVGLVLVFAALTRNREG